MEKIKRRNNGNKFKKMIQGLLTGRRTDEMVLAFIQSQSKFTPMYSWHTDGPEFKSVNLKKPVACFGVLRGTGDIMKKAKSDVYYFDHAYKFGNRHMNSKQIIGERIYRLTKNWQHIVSVKKLTDIDRKRIEKYKPFINIKPWKKSGKDIVLCDIGPGAIDYYTSKHYDVKQWFNQTLGRLKHIYGGRPKDLNFIVRGKPTPDKEYRVESQKPKSFDVHLYNAYAVVTFQSSIGITAILEGVPHFCDVTSMCAPVSRTGRGESSVNEIKDPFYPDTRIEWLNSLLANQFTMTEIRDGTAWKHVKDIPGETVSMGDYVMPSGIEIYLDKNRKNKR
jgi:hypothetical protein|tara:strand:- start:1414 stop:2415 length:1002 start_codon:yes stop_codon:yes gene_type:complete